MKVFMAVLLLVSLHRALSQDLTDTFAAAIKDCFFYEANSEESVELKCENELSHSSDYSKDNCYSTLFEDDSEETNRAKVRHLRTGQCQWSEFDDSLSKLFPNLISLDISYLGLDDPIARRDLNFKSLQKLNASNNQLNKIKDSMFINTKFITEIDFSHNNITSIVSTCMNGANSLTFINLSHNAIEYLQSSTFENMKNLRIIDLGHNKLYTFDMSMFRNNLEMREIHIPDNNIGRLVHDLEFVPNFNSLLIFMASGNHIDNLSAELLRKLRSALQELDLSNSDCSFITNSNDSFKGFRSLRHVNLAITRINTFDFGIFENPGELRSVDLSANYLEAINFTMKYGRFSNLEALNLRRNHLGYLDGASPEIFPKLSSIDIKWNRLTCENATNFVQQWKNITVDGDQCAQYDFSQYDLWNFIINSWDNVIKLSLNTGIFWIVVFFFKCKRRYWKAKQCDEAQVEESTWNDPKVEPVCEEPIYWEIEPREHNDTYDHLAFRGLHASKIKSHYDNAKVSK